MTGARLSIWCALLLCATGASSDAADDGRRVVVLVNVASPDSIAVGAHYARARAVPERNICRVRCTTSESISRRSFEQKVRGPLRAFLLRSGLASGRAGGTLALEPKYLVATYGVPVKIREDYSGADARKLPGDPRQANAAAVDSELCLIALPSHKLEGSLPNPLAAAAPDGPAPETPLLLAARLDGPTPEIAKGLVDAAIAAEQSGLVGVAYVDARGLADGAYKLGDDWLAAAAGALARAGFFTRMDRAPGLFPADMPMPDAAFYFGWYGADARGPMARPDFRFAPGAVAYHIHSGSAARVRTTRIGWVGPLLDRGAAATMGAVLEPFLDSTIDVGAFAHSFLAGKTFGESAYRAAPKVSWMMTFLGDPLYAPFRPDRRRAALALESNRAWRDLREAVGAAVKGDAASTVAICDRHGAAPLFLELGARARFAMGKDAEAAALYRKLARGAASEYAAVRAYGELGDHLLAREQKGDALGAYRDGARAHPRSPHVLPLCSRALALARHLEKPKIENELWGALAVNFPDKPLGRFAGGELWARGLRERCPQPVIAVKRLPAPPVIDGQPGDEAWKHAALIGALPNRSGPQLRPPRTRIRLGRDAEALYLLAEIRPGRGAPARAAAGAEAFSLMLSPWRDGERARKMTVPRRGPAASTLRGVLWRVGTLRATAADRAAGNAWLVEMRIPFAALGRKPPEQGVVWAANFADRTVVPQFPFRLVPSHRSWARCGSDPIAADCAGYLVFE